MNLLVMERSSLLCTAREQRRSILSRGEILGSCTIGQDNRDNLRRGSAQKIAHLRASGTSWISMQAGGSILRFSLSQIPTNLGNGRENDGRAEAGDIFLNNANVTNGNDAMIRHGTQWMAERWK